MKSDLSKVPFWLWRKQQGEGCDYTIGCGEKLQPLKEKTLTKAIEEACKIIAMNEPDYPEEGLVDPDCSEQLIEEAYVVQALEKIDVKSIYEENRRKLREESESETEKQEREQFEKLKKKFGK